MITFKIDYITIAEFLTCIIREISTIKKIYMLNILIVHVAYKLRNDYS